MRKSFNSIRFISPLHIYHYTFFEPGIYNRQSSLSLINLSALIRPNESILRKYATIELGHSKRERRREKGRVCFSTYTYPPYVIFFSSTIYTANYIISAIMHCTYNEKSVAKYGFDRVFRFVWKAEESDPLSLIIILFVFLFYDLSQTTRNLLLVYVYT